MIIIFLSSLSPLSTYLHYLCTVHAQSHIPRLVRDLLVVGKSGVFEQRVQLSRVLGHCEKLRQHWTLSRRNLEAEEEEKEGTNLEEDHVPGLQHLPPVFSLVGFHGDWVGTVADDQVVHLGTQSVHLIFVLVFKDKLVNRVLKSRTISG